MNLKQLRYFVTLCEEMNFSRAARQCGVSQPSLSEAIKALELEFGGQLIQRKPRGGLTNLGRAVLPLISSAIQSLDAAKQVANRLTGTEWERQESADPVNVADPV